MGKIKSRRSGDSKPVRNIPLEEQIVEDSSVKVSGREKKRKRRDEDDQFADERVSWKILQQARQQQEELQEEYGIAGGSSKKSAHSSVPTFNQHDFPRLTKSSKKTASDSESEDSGDDDDQLAADTATGALDYNPESITEDDEKAFEMFMSSNAERKSCIAESLKEKLTCKQSEIGSKMSDKASVRLTGLQRLGEKGDRMIKMLQQVRDILPKYRSGALPKVFKVLPKFEAWEEIVEFLEPDNWTAAAVYQATRIFVSNLNDKMAQRFVNLFLLPRVQDDIAEYKRLNYHLYQAMRKALFKPGAFFKGLILPLCEAGNCTLREATIISSVLAKNSIPLLHSAAAIIKIAEMDYNGANSIFLRTLLDKKYALPYQAVDAVVYHFLRFQTDKRTLPVLWHQCLLTFAQRYKESISSEQRDALLSLLHVHRHVQMTPEIRRELTSGKCRDELTDEMDVAAATASTAVANADDFMS